MRLFAMFLVVSLFFAAVAWGQKIAITVDDLPETSDVPPGTTRARIASQIVAELKAANAPQVYGFVNAVTLDDPAVKHVLGAWRQAGFLLGNHTYTHWNLDTKPLPVFERDILRNESVLKPLMAGEDWHWFRYPYLSEGSTLARRDGLRVWLQQHGYRIAEVTVNFDDDSWNDPYARCVAKHSAGSILQMKTMYLDAAAEALRLSEARSELLYHRRINHVLLLHMGGFAPVMLPTLLNLLKQRGYTLVTLPEAESDPVYQLDPATANDGGTLLDDLMEGSEFQDVPHTLPPTERLARLCR